MIIAASALDKPELVGGRIDIRRAAAEGWDVVVEYDHDHVAVEHYNEWRRVARRLTQFATRNDQSTN